jgi:hypothetical protein
MQPVPPGGIGVAHMPGDDEMLQRWPDGHEGDMQQVPSVQFPEAHSESFVQGRPFACGVGVRVTVGVAVGRLLQMPSRPITLQARFGPQSLAVQQTLSVQNRFSWHWPSSVHGSPIPRRELHIPSIGAMSQRCPTGHAGMLQQTPLTQFGGLHCSLALQPVPGGPGGPHVPLLQNSPCGQLGVPQQ